MQGTVVTQTNPEQIHGLSIEKVAELGLRVVAFGTRRKGKGVPEPENSVVLIA